MYYNIFKGLGIALVTPFQQDGQVDYEALMRLVDYQLNNGADFFCILARDCQNIVAIKEASGNLQMRGEYDPARKIHHRFTDLFSLLFVDGNPAGVKAMLHEMGFIENVLRLPLVPTRISTKQRMSELLRELKI